MNKKELWVDSHGGLWTAGWRYELRWADVGRTSFQDALNRGEIDRVDGQVTIFWADPEVARWAIERAHDRENGWD